MKTALVSVFLVGIIATAYAQAGTQLPTVSKVYETKYGMKSGSPTRIIETDKNGVSKVYETKYGVKTGFPTLIIETDKKGMSKVYDTRYGVKTGSPKAIVETNRK